MNHYFPKWVPDETQAREAIWTAYVDRFGWVKNPVESVTPEERRKGVDLAYRAYGAPFGEWFHVTPAVDLALHELLDTCRRERISVALLLMPEGSEFRSWYTPAARKAIDTYLDGLCDEYAIPVIDASRWIPDDCFADSHHLLPRGADLFSERLGREMIPVFLAGKLAPGRHARIANDP